MKKTVFITGSANGIGRHLSEVFYNQGFNVVATDFQMDKLMSQTQHWQSANTLVEQLNVTDSEHWQRVVQKAIQKFGKIDILLNVAGVITPGFVADFSLKDIDYQIDINVKGVMYGTKIIADEMMKIGEGHIINFASLAGVAPIHGLALYSASKFAVRGFSLAVRPELKEKGIQVSVICPDLVNTNMLTLQLDYEAAALTFSGNKPLKVEDMEKAVFHHALGKKQVEILVPSHRGFTAKLGNFFPSIGFWLTETLTKKGLKQQAAMKKQR
ncbi:MAG: SDR family oxidoreductase [Arcicella sp.]|jgi:3-oxoacyl-[acyl-carrier protein] reductase|nr:SDR family oxidoreductase [Arcicella sp.]